MLKTKIHILLTLIFAIALLVTACGGNNENPEAAIQTSVAETVAAQSPVVITSTPAEELPATKTPFAVPTLGSPIPLVSPTTGSTTSGKVECAKASLQEDGPPVDGKIFKPGDEFIKTWYIKNESTCVWDTTYKIIFWSGDILGGGYYYQLPQVTAPGQTVPVSLVLTAPSTPGKYRSEWKLQTPDNLSYGVGVYQSAFYTEIEVANLTTTTAITYDIVDASLVITRDPPTGCAPANMVYTANVTIVTNGPLKFKYTIRQQDGNSGNSTKVEMKEAGKYTNSDHVWKLGRAASQNSNRWMQLVITDPFYREYPPVGFEFYCP